jgi:hypothetical protein
MWKRRRAAARLQLADIAESLAASVYSGAGVHTALTHPPATLNRRLCAQLLELQRPSARRLPTPGGEVSDDLAALAVAMEACRQSHAELPLVLISLAQALRERHRGWPLPGRR